MKDNNDQHLSPKTDTRKPPNASFGVFGSICCVKAQGKHKMSIQLLSDVMEHGPDNAEEKLFLIFCASAASVDDTVDAVYKYADLACLKSDKDADRVVKRLEAKGFLVRSNGVMGRWFVRARAAQ